MLKGSYQLSTTTYGQFIPPMSGRNWYADSPTIGDVAFRVRELSHIGALSPLNRTWIIEEY